MTQNLTFKFPKVDRHWVDVKGTTVLFSTILDTKLDNIVTHYIENTEQDISVMDYLYAKRFPIASSVASYLWHSHTISDKWHSFYNYCKSYYVHNKLALSAFLLDTNKTFFSSSLPGSTAHSNTLFTIYFDLKSIDSTNSTINGVHFIDFFDIINKKILELFGENYAIGGKNSPNFFPLDINIGFSEQKFKDLEKSGQTIFRNCVSFYSINPINNSFLVSYFNRKKMTISELNRGVPAYVTIENDNSDFNYLSFNFNAQNIRTVDYYTVSNIIIESGLKKNKNPYSGHFYNVYEPCVEQNTISALRDILIKNNASLDLGYLFSCSTNIGDFIGRYKDTTPNNIVNKPTKASIYHMNSSIYFNPIKLVPDSSLVSIQMPNFSGTIAESTKYNRLLNTVISVKGSNSIKNSTYYPVKEKSFTKLDTHEKTQSIKNRIFTLYYSMYKDIEHNLSSIGITASALQNFTTNGYHSVYSHCENDYIHSKSSQRSPIKDGITRHYPFLTKYAAYINSKNDALYNNENGLDLTKDLDFSKIKEYIQHYNSKELDRNSSHGKATFDFVLTNQYAIFEKYLLTNAKLPFECKHNSLDYAGFAYDILSLLLYSLYIAQHSTRPGFYSKLHVDSQEVFKDFDLNSPAFDCPNLCFFQKSIVRTLESHEYIPYSAFYFSVEESIVVKIFNAVPTSQKESFIFPCIPKVANNSTLSTPIVAPVTEKNLSVTIPDTSVTVPDTIQNSLLKAIEDMKSDFNNLTSDTANDTIEENN